MHFSFNSHLSAVIDDFQDDTSNAIKRDNETVMVDDMILMNKQYVYLFSNDSSKRHGLARTFAHWPKGIVPVKFHSSITKPMKDRVFSAMAYIMAISCVRFDVLPKQPKNYVLIGRDPEGGCVSAIGNYRSGEQSLLISDACQKGNLIHELLHTLGFLHMHTATERDNFLKIHFDNIQPENHYNFQKYSAHVSMYGTPFDYDSIMHYGRNAFAVDQRKDTITPLKVAPNMGQRESKKKFTRKFDDF